MTPSLDRQDPPSSDRLGLSIACVLSLFVFAILSWPNPNQWSDLFAPLLFTNTTPSGGDMGAHIWGPAYMRDHLLPNFRLTGWTPDWYAGFPAYTYYMVVPALAIIALNTGLAWFVGLPLAAILGVAGWKYSARFGSYRRWARAGLVVLMVLTVGLPYGVAFKLVTVAGLIAFPVAAWAMARLAGAQQPIPAFAALASFIFLFDTNFIIYGGNVTSTLAGEFAFSLSLCLCLLAIGLTAKGMDEGRYRGSAAVLIGLVALCHIIPVFFMIPALVFLGLVDRQRSVALVVAAVAVAGAAPYMIATGLSGDGAGLLRVALAGAAIIGVLLTPIVVSRTIAGQAIWLTVTGVTAMALSAFWLLPFVAGEPYFNDMGWERLDEVGPALLTVPIKVALPVAAIGAVASFVLRERLGMMFTGTAILFASLVANVGESALWNARLLPFYYLSVYMLAAFGVAIVVRLLATASSERPDRLHLGIGVVVATLATLIAVSMPLRILPGGQIDASRDGAYRWLFLESRAESAVSSWAGWNYRGYEEKPSYREYRDVVATMAEVGESNGCGRAMWEYDKELDRYGTPMALMLLPFWTDGCIGSMEGLYFESSATTPFHFLNQSMLSDAPSRAQRDLPYRGFDIDGGVEQLQTMGVRYYMAQSDRAQQAAAEHQDLTEVARAEPFAVYEVADSDLVAGLPFEPVVSAGRSADEVAGSEGDAEEVSRFETGWLGQAVEFYNEPGRFDVLPAESGPEDWDRVTTLAVAAPKPLPPLQVSNVETTTDGLRFSVDQVGVPTLIKMSYFPHWNVSGADGPWRVGPNLMAVIPSETEVELSYGRSLVEVLSMLLSLLALVAIGVLTRLDRKLPVWPGRFQGQSAELPVAAVTGEEPGGVADLDPHAEIAQAPNAETDGAPNAEIDQAPNAEMDQAPEAEMVEDEPLVPLTADDPDAHKSSTGSIQDA